MTAEQFSYYLIDTSKLRDLGYQDLQNLTGQFPYCQNLHFLVAKKSHIENHPDFEKWLHLAATYSTDRSYLYQLLHEIDFEKEYTEEEKFDLEELVTPKEVEIKPELVSDNELIIHEVKPILEEKPKDIAIELPQLSEVNELETGKNNGSYDDYDDDEEIYCDDAPLITLSDLMKEEEIPSQNTRPIQESNELIEEEGKTSKPLPKTSFSSWKKNNSTKVENTNKLTLMSEDEIVEHKRRIEEKLQIEQEIKKKKKDKKKDKKKKNIEEIEFAKRSLIRNENLATETLAKVLELQGKNFEAIEMFEKLKLQIPEKSAFFAAEIERINVTS